MKKELIRITACVALPLFIIGRKRAITYLKTNLIKKYFLNRVPVLFAINKQGELRSILLGGLSKERKVIHIRNEDPNEISPLKAEQIKKLDGLYKCLRNGAITQDEIIIRTYATLLELTEEQLENFRGYLF